MANQNPINERYQALAKLPEAMAAEMRAVLHAAFPTELGDLDLLRLGGEMGRHTHDVLMSALYRVNNRDDSELPI